MGTKNVDVLGNEFQVCEYLEFEVDEYKNRLARLREAAGDNCDAVLLSTPENLRYFTGYRSLITRSRWRPIVFVVPIDEAIDPVLVLPEQDAGLGHATTWLDRIAIARESIRNGHDDPIEIIANEIKKLGLGEGRLAGEYGFAQRMGMTWDEQVSLRSQLAGAEFVDASEAIWATRAVKSQAEIELLREACRISCEGVREAFEATKAGMTEREIHRVMVESMTDLGADEVWISFGSGAKGYGASNAFPSDEPLKEGHFIWVDGGAYVQGYVCDFIRCAIIGEPSEDQRHWFDATHAANLAAVKTLGPGSTGAKAFAAAKEVLEEAGVISGWGLDVLGHGVGLELHELPSLTADSHDPLKPGYVITIEPSLSPPRHEHGHYIVEEVVAITDDGYDILTSSLSTDLWVV